MTTAHTPRSDELARLGIDPEFLEAALEELECNTDFFVSHERDLWEQYPGMYLLIYDRDVVEAFENYDDLLDRLDELDRETRASALTKWQKQGVWIL